MYTKWARKQGYKGRIVEKSVSKSGGIKSATIEFESKYAYGYLSGERGVHRLTRSSQDQSMSPEVQVPLPPQLCPTFFCKSMFLCLWCALLFTFISNYFLLTIIIFHSSHY